MDDIGDLFLSESDLEFDTRTKSPPRFRSLFFSGGGILVVSMLGCLHGLEECGYLRSQDTDIYCYAGISCGSIVSLLLAVGYSVKEMIGLMYGLDFKLFGIAQSSGSGGGSEMVIRIIESFGADDGERLMDLLRLLIEARCGVSDLTFHELQQRTGKHLIVQAVCLTTGLLETFSPLSTPKLSVLLAVRMSVAIPFMITPVCYEGRLYVDGAVASNTPVIGEINKYYDIDMREVLVVRTTNQIAINPEPITNVVDYGLRILYTLYNNVEYDPLSVPHSVDVVYDQLVGKVDIGSYTQKDFCVLFRTGYDRAITFIEEFIDEATSVGSSDGSSDGSTETPTEGSTETPTEGSTETPTDGSTETPTEGSIDSPATDTDSITTVCIVNR